ncbi:MAG: hypothetical protein BGO82_05485 [Devosia sp. 67-54]|uniref:hypothetical protein n=1 Tax=unclassified Devosia TaxID=196773 RepID=UPI000965D807|nr:MULTISPECIES: hypothetical protein [unclassified Devosia]MBN9306931.1 hypothetical protein [Devosia sp.]OJX17116.1 MAG: hypothetical protein BGO82_05485 [Devosia sp. 67-54]
MIILAIVASLAGIAVLCWLLFTLAVFALPFFAAMAVGGWAYATGAGIAGAILLAAIATAATFALFQLLLLVLRRNWLKLIVALAFAAPSTVAGYHATLGIVRLTMPSEPWQIIFAVVGAVAVGITAVTRLTMMTAPSEPARGRIPQAP